MGRKVAYVLRFRYVVFATLRNQLIFYGKTCWFRSVVTPTSRKRNTYTTFACWVEASSGLGGHFSMDFSLKRLCKIGIFAILRSPRCATSTFFDKKWAGSAAWWTRHAENAIRMQLSSCHGKRALGGHSGGHLFFVFFWMKWRRRGKAKSELSLQSGVETRRTGII